MFSYFNNNHHHHPTHASLLHRTVKYVPGSSEVEVDADAGGSHRDDKHQVEGVVDDQRQQQHGRRRPKLAVGQDDGGDDVSDAAEDGEAEANDGESDDDLAPSVVVHSHGAGGVVDGVVGGHEVGPAGRRGGRGG